MIGLWDYVCVYSDAGRRDVEQSNTIQQNRQLQTPVVPTKPQIYVYLYI